MLKAIFLREISLLYLRGDQIEKKEYWQLFIFDVYFLSLARYLTAD